MFNTRNIIEFIVSLDKVTGIVQTLTMQLNLFILNTIYLHNFTLTNFLSEYYITCFDYKSLFLLSLDALH